MAKDCVTQISAQNGMDVFTKEEIAEVVAQYDRVKKSKSHKAAAFWEQLVEEGDYRSKQALLRRSKAVEKNLELKKRIIEPLAESFTKDPELKLHGKLDLTKTGGINKPFSEVLYGSHKTKAGGNLSADMHQKEVNNRLLHVLDGELEKSGNSVELRSGRFDLEVAEVFDRVASGESLNGISKVALSGYKILKNFNDEVLTFAKEKGMVMDGRANYMARQVHDPDKILSNIPQWKQEIVELLDVENPIGILQKEDETVEDFLDAMVDDLREGTYDGFKPGGFGGHRVLQFKDMKSAALYNQKWGNGTLLETATKTRKSFSRKAGLSAVLGPDPAAAYKYLEDGVRKVIPGELRSKFDDSQYLGSKSVRWGLFAEAAGYPRSSSHYGTSYHTITRLLSATAGAANLGASLISTLGDFPTVVMNHIETTGDSRNKFTIAFEFMKDFSKTFSGLDEASHKMALQTLNLEAKIATGEVYSRWGGLAIGNDYGGSRWTDKTEGWLREVIKLTGLPRQSRVGRELAARHAGIQIAHYSDLAFDKIPERLKAKLEASGFTKQDWEFTRRAVAELPNGSKIADASLLYNYPETRATASKLSVFYNDIAHTSIQEASGLERGAILQGISPDTMWGSLLRLSMIFKSFPLARVKTFRKLGLADPNLKAENLLETFQTGELGPLKTLGQLVVYSTFMESLATFTKNELNGKETKIDGKFFAQHVQKAAAPLMVSYAMDVMKGVYANNYRSLPKDIAGPVLGQLFDVGDILKDDILGLDPKKKKHHAAVKSIKLLTQNLPGGNIPILAPIMRKTVLEAVQEMVDPEYFNRMKARQYKNSGSGTVLGLFD